MKLTKFFIMFFILTLSFVACRVSKLEITKPGFKGANSISRGGTNYNLEGTYGDFLGIYKEASGTNYLVALPDVGDVKINEEQKKALDEIINTVGEENIGGVFSEVSKSKDGNIDIDKVVGNADISEEEKKKIKDLIDKNFQGKDLDYNIYN